MNEFELIQKFFAVQPVRRKDVALGIGDDAALLEVPAGMQLVATVDSLVAGMHFPASLSAEDIGHRALAVNLSDLAAMGAEPAWALLALTLPEVDEKWLTDFARGFFALSEHYKMTLVGGNIARGALNITAAVHGFAPRGKALTRRGAKPGDGIYVTGELGAAAAGLRLLQNRISGPGSERLCTRFARPEPRIAAGLGLRELASAAIDISDGFLADLVHILQLSGVGAEVEVDALPLAAEAVELLGQAEARQLAFAGGDDYELCFTLPLSKVAQMNAQLSQFGCPVTRVGVITAEKSLHCLQADGSKWIPDADISGYQHFQ